MSVDGQFTVAPSLPLLLWTMAVLALVIVTALKGRWVWLVVGLILGGAPLLISAFLRPRPRSLWARWARRRRESRA